jgi:hypothetical protein
MAELAALLNGGAVIEQLPPRRPLAAPGRPPAATAEANPGVKPARARKYTIGGNRGKARSGARGALRLNVMNPRPADDRTSQQWDEVTLAAARSAKDHRSLMLENFKVNAPGSPDSVDEGVSANPAPSALERAGDPIEEEKKDSETAKRETHAPPDNAIYRAKMLELINANVNAILDYAHRLAQVRSPADFVELSTSHACRHFDLVIRHLFALAALYRSLPPCEAAKEGAPSDRGDNALGAHEGRTTFKSFA